MSYERLEACEVMALPSVPDGAELASTQLQELVQGLIKVLRLWQELARLDYLLRTTTCDLRIDSKGAKEPWKK
jgi:hypothetical protein